MYATIRSYSGSQIADALVQHEDDVKSLVSGIDGFRGYWVVRGDDGSAATISVYDDKTGADESNQKAAEWVGENLSDLDISPPQVTAGEVVISA